MHEQEVVTEEVICPKLQELLFFMHSFLTAKVYIPPPHHDSNNINVTYRI
jgi:hypothetical protein